MKYQIFSAIVMGTLLFGALASVASAHVVVKPASAGIGARTAFTLGVPNEKEIPTTALRLIVPAAVESVTPNVAPGWKITIKKEGNGEQARVTEILWTGGSIPSGQRVDFAFSAKMPSNETTLVWKAYQTYASGEVVAWDADPQAEEQENKGPYSETQVVNDLEDQASISAPSMQEVSSRRQAMPATLLSIAALALSIISLVQVRRALRQKEPPL